MFRDRIARIFNKQFVVRTVCSVIVVVLIAAFFPPLFEAQAQKEIASSLLRFVIRREIGATADFIRFSGQPWTVAPPDANIIIWAPMLSTVRYHPDLKDQDPIQVWWYMDGQLIETPDKQESVLEYRQRYMEDPAPNLWAWGYYAFGILSISKVGWLAEVYVEANCGLHCGHGYRYMLMRGPFGRWVIIGATHLWQS